MLTNMVADLVKTSFDDLQTKNVEILLKELDAQYKFAKEFNSELTLRFRLWKAGYQSNIDQLPGLLVLEEKSLKVYLYILF